MSTLTQPSSAEEVQSRVRRATEAVIGEVFTEGNSVRVLRNGVEIFPAMLDAIRSATRTIEFVTFVYWTGDVAVEFADAFAGRARAGVRVRVVLDGFGAAAINQSLIAAMKEAGVALEMFRPPVRWKLWEADHRTHRKILICDDSVAFTGGVGIAEEWSGNADDEESWRDTHFEIRGPAVVGLRAAFISDWRNTGHSIDPADLAPPSTQALGNTAIAVVDAAAQIGLNNAELILEALVASARQRVVIQTPYFNPTIGLEELLVTAIERGVEVSILIPGPHIDKEVSKLVAEDRLVPLIEAGAVVWQYQPTMMHTKAVLVDGTAALLGSVNVNHRSVYKDEEVALVAVDPDLVAKLEDQFREDVRSSLRVRASDLEQRPVLERLAAGALRRFRNEF